MFDKKGFEVDKIEQPFLHKNKVSPHKNDLTFFGRNGQPLWRKVLGTGVRTFIILPAGFLLFIGIGMTHWGSPRDKYIFYLMSGTVVYGATFITFL
jgi:hypothetical protein